MPIFFLQVVLGKSVEQDASFVNSISEELISLTNDGDEKVSFEVVTGDTMCCDDFYEGLSIEVGSELDLTFRTPKNDILLIILFVKGNSMI